MRDDLAPLVTENTADTVYGKAIQHWSPSWAADGSAIAHHRDDPTAPPGQRVRVRIHEASGDPADARQGFASPSLAGPPHADGDLPGE